MFRRPYIDSVRYVSELDPAIVSGHSEYVDAGYDIAKLKLRDGESPTVFILGALTTRQQLFVGSAINDRHRAVQELQLSLRGVENYAVETSSGQPIDTLSPEREAGSEIGRPVTIAWLDSLHLGVEIIFELAVAINKISGPLAPLASASQ